MDPPSPPSSQSRHLPHHYHRRPVHLQRAEASAPPSPWSLHAFRSLRREAPPSENRTHRCGRRVAHIQTRPATCICACAFSFTRLTAPRYEFHLAPHLASPSSHPRSSIHFLRGHTANHFPLEGGGASAADFGRTCAPPCIFSYVPFYFS